ncbi:MAG: hypothetical protein JNN28_20500 [Saprospiraceae bacterium]|nr:hypothetical protein [Saprospiraceae bacterium]
MKFRISYVKKGEQLTKERYSEHAKRFPQTRIIWKLHQLSNDFVEHQMFGAREDIQSFNLPSEINL